MKTAKELLAAMRALFDVNPAPPPVSDPIAPSPTGGGTVFSYPIDGGVTVYVDCSDDGIADIDVNDKVYTDAAMTIPYPDGTYKVTGTDFSFTVAAGIVTVVTDADGTGPGVSLEDAMKNAPAPVPAPAPASAPIPAPMSAPIPPKFEAMTPEGTTAIFAAFATGTPEERIANLEVVARALMEYNFGWQIQEAQRKATTDQAINVYKQDLVTAQAALAKQDLKLKAMFDLMEEFAKIPTAEPKTLTGNKKEAAEKFTKAETRLDRMGKALKELKEEGQTA